MIIFIAPPLGKDEKKKLKTCLQCSKILAVQDSQPRVHGPFIFSLVSSLETPLLCPQVFIVLRPNHSFGYLLCCLNLSLPFLLFSFGNNFSIFFLFHVVSLFIITQCYFPIFDLCTTPLCHKISKTFCTVFVPHVHELYASENVS